MDAQRRWKSFYWAMAAAAVCPALLTGAGPAAAAPQVASGHWGKAQPVQGTIALNTGGGAQIRSISCPTPGTCGAVGHFRTANGDQQAFVVAETSGAWGAAQELPSLEALNTGGQAEVNEVSCPSPGNCATGGSYTDSSGNKQAFVVDQTHGTWGTAIEVPGTAAVNTGGRAAVRSMSCPSPGNCAAVGVYLTPQRFQIPFIVTERHGVWGTAKKVPGLAALGHTTGGEIGQISCPTVGNCSTGGAYGDKQTQTGQAWVADEVNGKWGRAMQVPGVTALDPGGDTALFGLSCASPGNCGGAGEITLSSGQTQGFVVNETKGTWGTAIKVPGLEALNRSFVDFGDISCTSPGNCSAGGSFTGTSGFQEAFVVDETNGTWGTAQEVPGIEALNKAGDAQIFAVSCFAPGDCSAGGAYTPFRNHFGAFVVTETNGTWGTAIQVPGTGALNQGKDAGVDAISCTGPGECGAGGSYADSSRFSQAFVVNER